MTSTPPTQYATDANLRARQRLWEHGDGGLDLFGWVLDLAGIQPGHRVLDVGCGNGLYLRRLRERDVEAVGCDLSLGMLGAAAPHPFLINGNAERLPFRASAFDVVLAPHMLYHVDDRAAAAREIRRVLRTGGRCVAVTNGRHHMRALRDLVEAAGRKTTAGWEMRNPSTHIFSLENGGEQLAVAFDSVECVRPGANNTAVVRDPTVVADYLGSVGDVYQPEIDRPWSEIVEEVTAAVEEVIERDGEFRVSADFGALVCS